MIDQMGRDLDRCVGNFNRMVGSMERRVLVSARGFEDLGVVATEGGSLSAPDKIEQKSRSLDRSNRDDATSS